MRPGRELDALIAEKIMNLKVVQEIWNDGKSSSYSLGEPDYWYTVDRPEGYLSNPVPHYSTKISDAYEVVEEICESKKMRHTLNSSPTGNYSEFENNAYIGEPDLFGSGWQETAAYAICLAALKTLERTI